MPNTNGQGAEARRGPSIRRPLYLLVAVPLLTVIGLYGFVLYTTVGDAINLDRAPALINATSVPAAQFNINVQNERKASMVYLAAPTAANRAQLQAAQNTTTQAFPAFQAKMTQAWLVALAIGLAGLRWPDAERGQRIPTDGIAIELLVDVSGSMAEEDFDWEGKRISRLDHHQHAATHSTPTTTAACPPALA